MCSNGYYTVEVDGVYLMQSILRIYQAAFEVRLAIAVDGNSNFAPGLVTTYDGAVYSSYSTLQAQGFAHLRKGQRVNLMVYNGAGSSITFYYPIMSITLMAPVV